MKTKFQSDSPFPVVLGALLGMIVWLGGVFCVLYVAYHFIAKFW